MSLSMPPGTLRTASIQTKEYLNNTNGDEATYRGNSVLPVDVVSRKSADSFSQARIRDDSFAEPPGIDGSAGIDEGLMDNPPGVLQSSPDEGFIIKRPRQFSQDTVGSSDMESIPRMSVTSLPSPGLPEQISSENHPSFSSMSTSSASVATKKEQQPRRETYTSPASVPSTNSATNSAPSKDKETPTISPSSSLALDISLRVSSDADEDEITKQTRIDIAKRLGVPLSSVTIVGTSDTPQESSMRSKRMSTMTAENTMLNANALRIRPIAKNPISRQHYQCLRAIYTRLNPERSNTLSTSSISNALMSKDLNTFLFSPARLREGPSTDDLRERFDFVSQRKIADRVSFDEFVAFCAMSEKEWLSYLERIRVYHLVSYKCPSLTPSKIRIAIEVFSRYDANGNGVVYKTDFLPYFEGSAELAELLMLVPGDSIRASEFLTCCNHIAFDETDQEFADNLKMSR